MKYPLLQEKSWKENWHIRPCWHPSGLNISIRPCWFGVIVTPGCPVRTGFCDKIWEVIDIIDAIHEIDRNTDISMSNNNMSLTIWPGVLQNIGIVFEEFVDNLPHSELAVDENSWWSDEDIKRLCKTIATKYSS